MNNYKVKMSYRGTVEFEVKASTQDEAAEKAEQMFDEDLETACQNVQIDFVDIDGPPDEDV